jgi:hypothetical protein
MALTIRSLSPEAEKTLEHIKKTKPSVNTNTKAIDFVLSDYLIQKETVQSMLNKYEKLKAELIEKEEEIRLVKEGFRIIDSWTKERF